jgi:hypothetical protein
VSAFSPIVTRPEQRQEDGGIEYGGLPVLYSAFIGRMWPTARTSRVTKPLCHSVFH